LDETIQKEFEAAKEIYKKLRDFDFESRRRILGYLLIITFRQEKNIDGMVKTLTSIIADTIRKEGWLEVARYISLLLALLASQGDEDVRRDS